MWQRFTDRARKVILLGQDEARRLGSGSVGTEHLLLGLVRENEGVAAQILESMGVGSEKLREAVERESPSSVRREGAPNLTPRSKRVLELAAEEAQRMKHNYIGTEHLLLALLREKDGVAAKVLSNLGLDLHSVRDEVYAYLGPKAGGHPPRTEVGSQTSQGPDLYTTFDWLLHTVDDEIAVASSPAASESLEKCHLQLENLRTRLLVCCGTSTRFEKVAAETVKHIDWYKEQALNAAEYGRATVIRALEVELKATLDEIRKVLDSQVEDEG